MTDLAPTQLRLERRHLTNLVSRCLDEDLGPGDLTARFLPGADLVFEATLLCKQSGVLAGMDVAAEVFRQLSAEIHFAPSSHDGDSIEPGQHFARVIGPVGLLLQGERTALNFLQRLSGIATLTRKFVDAVEGTGAKIADTRKTTPGLRILEKYAVKCGGGANHRFGLYDAVMLKDNHLSLGVSLTDLVNLARTHVPHTTKIVVECDTLEQLEEALSARSDVVLLDNMSLDNLKEGVRLAQGRCIIEASGGVTLGNVREIAETGVNIISVGALTHSAPALDLSMEIIGIESF